MMLLSQVKGHIGWNGSNKRDRMLTWIIFGIMKVIHLRISNNEKDQRIPQPKYGDKNNKD